MFMKTPRGLVVAVLLFSGALRTTAQQPAGAPLDCAKLTGLTFEGNTSITSATLVTDGTLVISPTVTATNLPPFCRVQGVSKPSSASLFTPLTRSLTEWSPDFHKTLKRPVGAPAWLSSNT